MARRRRLAARTIPGSLACALALSACSSSPKHNPWSQLTSSSRSEPASWGAYDAGCLAGAVSLPPDGPGFKVMRPSRRRYYGHPDLIAFVRWLGEQTHKKKLGPVLLGDLAQPRGGPIPYGHSSHQTGLDVDIWYQSAPSPELTLDERENLSARSVLADFRTGLSPALWTPAQMELVRLAAQHDRVERIFVDPWIKKAFCDSPEKGKPWLAKVRPWWKHHDHFHVRLRCPESSPGCKAQSPVTAGDGCDETLSWWFSEEGMQTLAEAEQPKAPGSYEWKMPVLPQQCEALLQASPDSRGL